MQISLFETDVDEKIHDTFIKDLKRGSGFENGKKRIYNFFNQNLSKVETIKLLKDEYGFGGRSSIASGGYSQRHDTRGIKIEIATGEKRQYTWNQVYDAISNLIKRGEYLEGEE